MFAVRGVISAVRLNTPTAGTRAFSASSVKLSAPIRPRSVKARSATAMAAVAEPVGEFIDAFNSDYARIHKAYEDNFWATKMNLKGNSTDALTESFNALEAFLGDRDTLDKVRGYLAGADATDAQVVVLKHIEKTLGCYIVESAEAKKVREEAVALENKMNSARNKLGLTYVESDGTVTDATPTVLRTKIRSAADESVRKSCWEATRRVGPFLLENGFPKIIAERNRFARTLGFVDFYDMKVTQAEGFSKARCFEMLDGLETATRPILDAALAKLKADKGEDALKPWNISYALSGELSREMDPYFPFENAPEVWGRSFAAMGIRYRDTKMQLDLCDRKGKYPNGFCHWPIAPHKAQDGTWNASQANFTSLATPDEVGSGNTALTTLMHEGGHAAHFANIEQGSPLFSQERAPFSVSLAETQSMFLDSLCGDAAWLGRYAKDRSGSPIPWDLLERSIREKHPFEVFMLRGMIAVPYFEKALYELDEADLTAENIERIADEIEHKIQGGLAARPLLSVPHQRRRTMFAISAQTLTARPVALRARSAASRSPRAFRIATAAAKKDAPKEEPKEEAGIDFKGLKQLISMGLGTISGDITEINLKDPTRTVVMELEANNFEDKDGNPLWKPDDKGYVAESGEATPVMNYVVPVVLGIGAIGGVVATLNAL